MRLVAFLRRRAATGLLTLALVPAFAPATARASPDAGPAASPPAALTAAPAAAASAELADDALRYTVVLAAPDSLKPLLQTAVDLVRWQRFEYMTEDLFDRLAREAVGQAREAAAADGYFSAEVDVAIDRATDPVTVTLRVDTGEPTRVAQVRIVVTGPATTDGPAGTAVIAKVQDEWPLTVGQVFRQQPWAAAKAQAVAILTASPYAAAALTHSEALVDPEARTADLDLELASGPPFRFGALAITGLSRYDIELVRNFSPISAGDPYSRQELDRFLRRLNGSGYFASVHASIDPDPAQADDATVNVAVIEAPPKRLEAGIGYSTDTEFRGNLSYSDMNIDGHALQFYADGRIEQKLQSGSLRFVRPPNADAWIDSASASVIRTDIENLITETAIAAVRRESVDERDRWGFGAAYLLDRQHPSGAESTSAHALYVDVARTWRRNDDIIAPTRGYNFNLQLGAGIPGVSSRSFGRVIAQFAAWHPFPGDNELTARAELGAVIADSRDGIPSALLFRTGGDTTVRGYAFESLGVKNGDATVPGRYLAVASIEAIHWFAAGWGLAAFVDAGNAADEVGDLKDLAYGYGAGLRLKTPIGPFRFDLAYGQQTAQVRVHFSVGLSF